MVKGRYDEKIDIWAAGIILHILLCGYIIIDNQEAIRHLPAKTKKLFLRKYSRAY
jgi:serine/threonine protein kinase